MTNATLFDSAELDTPHVLADASWIIQSDAQAGLVACLDDADDPANFLLVYHDGTSIVVEKCVSDTYTTIATSAQTYVPSAKPTVVVLPATGGGLDVRVRYNGVDVGNWTVTDAGIIGNKLHGLFSTHENNTCSEVGIYETTDHNIPGTA